MLIPKNLESLSLAGNSLTDKEISLLAPKLPRSLISLNISGSQMGEVGAFFLAKHMPSLTKLNVDFRYKNEDKGFFYLLQNLSPFLTNLSKLSEPISYKNSLLFSNNFPKFLFNFEISSFEVEESKIIFNGLSPSLRRISLGGDIKSKGDSLNILSKHLPEKLLAFVFGTGFKKEEMDLLLHNKNLQYILINPSLLQKSFSPILVKHMSQYILLMNGSVTLELFKGINLPVDAGFYGNIDDYPKGFLRRFHSSQLKDLFLLGIGRFKEDINDFVYFFKNLPPFIQDIHFETELKNIKYEDLDRLIEGLPKNLRRLSVKYLIIGEKGLEKFRTFKAKMEERTGIPFMLLE